MRKTHIEPIMDLKQIIGLFQFFALTLQYMHFEFVYDNWVDNAKREILPAVLHCWHLRATWCDWLPR